MAWSAGCVGGGLVSQVCGWRLGQPGVWVEAWSAGYVGGGGRPAKWLHITCQLHGVLSHHHGSPIIGEHLSGLEQFTLWTVE